MKSEKTVGSENVKSSGRMRGSKDAWPLIWDKLLPVGDGGSVLDTGCGEHFWEAEGWVVKRCDNGEEYVGQDRQLPDSVEHVELSETWPYRENEFSGVIAADVIEHLENIWHFFREATRVSRDFVIITTPNTTSDVSKFLFKHYDRFWGFTPSAVRASNHINPIFLWQIKLAAERAGWAVDRVEYINTNYYMLHECPKAAKIIESQPGKRGLVVRMGSRRFLRDLKKKLSSS